MKILRESMTKLAANGWIIRIWCQEGDTGIASKSDLIAKVHRLAKEHDDQEKFTLAVVKLDTVNAVEVLHANGCGQLAYRDWP